jgi:hypothetical protein
MIFSLSGSARFLVPCKAFAGDMLEVAASTNVSCFDLFMSGGRVVIRSRASSLVR